MVGVTLMERLITVTLVCRVIDGYGVSPISLVGMGLFLVLINRYGSFCRHSLEGMRAGRIVSDGQIQ